MGCGCGGSTARQQAAKQQARQGGRPTPRRGNPMTQPGYYWNGPETKTPPGKPKA